MVVSQTRGASKASETRTGFLKSMGLHLKIMYVVLIVGTPSMA